MRARSDVADDDDDDDSGDGGGSESDGLRRSLP
jgi:hypothetical protein